MSNNNVKKFRLNWILTLTALLLLFSFIDRYLNKLVFPGNDYLTFCRDKIVLYSYCKDTIHIKDVSKEKLKDRIIKNNINSEGISMHKSLNFKVSEAELIIMGDSFIEADEINQNKKFGYLLNKYKKTIEIGYRSWNSYQYNKLFEKYKFKEDATFYVFLFTNDFAPNYEFSFLNVKKNIKKFEDLYNNDKIKKQTIIYKIKEKFLHESFTYNAIKKLYINKKNNLAQESSTKKFDIKTLEVDFKNCNIDLEKDDIHLDIYDSIIFSKHYSCWPKEYLTYVNSEIASLKKLKNNLKKNQKVEFFFISPGWSFYNENTIGKTSHPYNLSVDSIITQKGLSNYLDMHLGIIDTANIINEVKKKSLNEYYLPLDGHWNENAHYLIFRWIENNLI